MKIENGNKLDEERTKSGLADEKNGQWRMKGMENGNKLDEERTKSGLADEKNGQWTMDNGQ